MSSNAALVTFQLYGLSGDVDLVARKGLPLPTTLSYDYASMDPGTSDEQILISTNSNPLPLSPGRWYLGVFNVDYLDVTNTILATAQSAPSTNIVITGLNIRGTSLCITWGSVPDFSYYIEGALDVTSTNWTPVSPAIMAVDYTTTYCVPWPTPFQFFRVRAGVPSDPNLTPVAITGIAITPNGILLEWSGAPDAQYNVQWASSPEGPWNFFYYPATSPTGSFSFLDDGSETGGLDGARFYRLYQTP